MRSSHGDPDLRGQIIGGRAPNRRIYLDALERTLKLMANPSTDTVPRVFKAIENNLIYPFKHTMDQHTKDTVAEQMAKMNCGHTFKEYLEFLKRSDLDSEKLSVQCYDAILEMANIFSSISMSMCRDCGKSGFLKLVIQNMVAMKSEWLRVSKLINQLIIYRMVIHVQ